MLISLVSLPPSISPSLSLCLPLYRYRLISLSLSLSLFLLSLLSHSLSSFTHSRVLSISLLSFHWLAFLVLLHVHVRSSPPLQLSVLACLDLCASLYLTHSLSRSPQRSLSLSTFVSLERTEAKRKHSFSFSIPLSVYLSHSLSLSLFLSLFLSPCAALSLSLSLCLFLSPLRKNKGELRNLKM